MSTIFVWEDIKIMKIKILIPVFNDWESLIKLLKEIDENIKGIENISFHCLVVNDASTIDSNEREVPILKIVWKNLVWPTYISNLLISG